MSRASPVTAAYQSLLSRGRLHPNPGQAALVDRLSQLQESLAIRDPNRSNNGVYIYGGVGTGKSRIADLFASTLPATVTSRRVHFHEFMVETHLRLHRARSEANYRGDPLIHIGREIQEQSAVLCLDEFQVSDIADAMILKRLFGSFWNSGGVMISTSNRHPSELYLNGLNRPLFLPFIRELEQRCLVWKMEGDRDYRLDTGETKYGRVQVFFTDAVAFDAALAKATNGETLKPSEIEVVMNRKLSVQATQTFDPTARKTIRAIVHSTFVALCEASLGASDYHALCNFAGTIFLSGLRQFRADELDFVRRFITLIDIAYESRSRVVCLSNVNMAQVFENIGVKVSKDNKHDVARALDKHLTVKGEGGSSSSMMSTFIDDVEWSATGLTKASLATGGAGETDVRFAIGRAISRLSEMSSSQYGVSDDQMKLD